MTANGPVVSARGPPLSVMGPPLSNIVSPVSARGPLASASPPFVERGSPVSAKGPVVSARAFLRQSEKPIYQRFASGSSGNGLVTGLDLAHDHSHYFIT